MDEFRQDEKVNVRMFGSDLSLKSSDLSLKGVTLLQISDKKLIKNCDHVTNCWMLEICSQNLSRSWLAGGDMFCGDDNAVIVVSCWNCGHWTMWCTLLSSGVPCPPLTGLLLHDNRHLVS